jgi:signal transduction histidine kinase
MDAVHGVNTWPTTWSVFLAGRSHELRTPLNAVLSRFRGIHRARQRDAARGARDQRPSPLSLLNDNLEIARMDANMRRSVEQAHVGELFG